ncbi:MAG: HAD family phosphatase [Brevinematales bacterium]|nr:HAD family phosphatase [Brevinematales bacterium]
MSEKLKAVIFDFDGTLVDSEKNYYISDRNFLKEFGIEFTEEMQKEVSGMGNLNFIKKLKKEYGIKGNEKELLERKNAHYLAIAKNNTKVFPEMKRFLDILKENGYKLGLASGSSPYILDILLEETGLIKYFDVVLSSESENIKNGKPHPDVYLEAARRLNFKPYECAAVEDSKYGVEAAKNAEMSCIAVPYVIEKPLHPSFYKADLLFENGIKDFKSEIAFSYILNFS